MKRLASLTLGLSFFIASGLATWLVLEVNQSPIASNGMDSSPLKGIWVPDWRFQRN